MKIQPPTKKKNKTKKKKKKTQQILFTEKSIHLSISENFIAQSELFDKIKQWKKPNKEKKIKEIMTLIYLWATQSMIFKS